MPLNPGRHLKPSLNPSETRIKPGPGPAQAELFAEKHKDAVRRAARGEKEANNRCAESNNRPSSGPKAVRIRLDSNSPEVKMPGGRAALQSDVSDSNGPGGGPNLQIWEAVRICNSGRRFESADLGGGSNLQIWEAVRISRSGLVGLEPE